jgi:hypothetical protein
MLLQNPPEEAVRQLLSWGIIFIHLLHDQHDNTFFPSLGGRGKGLSKWVLITESQVTRAGAPGKEII